MDSNTHLAQGPTGPADDLAELTALLDRLAARDLDRFPDAARAERALELRRLADRWKASGSRNSPGWTPAGRPGPNRTAGSGPPPAGSEPACG